ncbi:MAG: hypothetical protein JO013_01295 [Alphaproteobacteria bacterium]|nr:hypothetical protein [Alphaproteobacteria bacterium]
MFVLLASLLLGVRSKMSLDDRRRRIAGVVLAAIPPLLLLAFALKPAGSPLIPAVILAALAADAYLFAWGLRSRDPQGLRNFSAVAGAVLLPLILFDAVGLAIVPH